LGVCSKNVDSHFHPSESEVIVTATPNEGWQFSHWLLDDVNSGNSNPFTVSMDRWHTLVAEFSEVIDPGPNSVLIETIIVVVAILAVGCVAALWFFKFRKPKTPKNNTLADSTKPFSGEAGLNICPKCKNMLQKDELFCSECGQKIT